MEDTICAISTSAGIGAISIIRVSGERTVEIVNSIFSSDITNEKSHTIKYGHILDENNEVLDEVLLMIMLKPKTYTTEDTIEINCHGGYNTTNKVLELLLNKGCRLAEPGEFTKRAYLNGRINLLQSEAVNQLITSKTDSKRKMALNQMGANLTKKIENVRELLVSLMANIEVNIDFPEYVDNLIITESLLKEKLSVIKKELEKLVDGTKFGNIVSNGIKVAIVGKPNVGKSSILNHLLDEEKAIVTNVAGTTRDIVEGTLSLNGIEVHLIDTAGIHETEDIVEKIGVEKSKEAIKNSDVTLLVLDGSRDLDNEDKELLEIIDKENTIIFINKNDSLKSTKITTLDAIYGNTLDLNGLDELKSALIEKFNINEINKDLTYLSSARQISLIKKANQILTRALESLENQMPIDLIENDLKECFETLGELIGDSYDGAVVDRLFRDFCVGK